MRILITGTAGFIGNNLALRMLKEGHEVAGVDAVTDYYDVDLKRDRLKRLESYESFSEHEYRLEEFDKLAATFESFKPQRVVHLAAQAGVRYSLKNPRAYVEANVTGSFNVIELCKQYGVEHLVIASTSSAYGANDVYPYNETDRAAFPLTTYAATKQASELIAHSHSHLFDIPTTVMRFFTVYGPWGRPDMAFFLFTKAMFENKPIDVYNHGKMIRDFTYVDDLTKAIRLLVDTPPVKGQPITGVQDSLSPVAPYRLVNIGNADPVSLMDFIQEIEKNVGVKAQMNMMDMQPGDVPKTFANSDLLEHLTGYRPTGNIQDGVKAFVDWYRVYYNVGLN